MENHLALMIKQLFYRMEYFPIQFTHIYFFSRKPYTKVIPESICGYRFLTREMCGPGFNRKLFSLFDSI